MDVCFDLHGITFIWDEEKARKNLIKHGIAFEQAAETFFDPFVRMIDASPEDETRDAVIGMDENWNLLFVVHVEIEQDRIRIVSARKAARVERQYYET